MLQEHPKSRLERPANSRVISPLDAPNSTVRPSILQMFAERVELAPHALAVAAGERAWTYAELNRRADRLANRLQSLGVAAESIVAICLNRSPESVMSMLAVLKSGGAFLPLDPNQPGDRLNSMLDDANPAVIITKTEFSARLTQQTRAVINLERDSDDGNYAGEFVSVAASADQLAYVIYTSGSTGKPKGVEVTHANLLNLIAWHHSEFGVDADDRASHLASVGFDATVWEVWPYLTAGASVYLPNEEVRLSPKLMRDWLVENQITISFLPTPLAEQIMRLDWPDHTALRFLLTGADMLHRYPGDHLPFTLVNNYGPTECTVVATSGRVLPANAPDFPPIGRPIVNTTVYILDENLDQVPRGETGELYVGGAGVARGYLNQPALTAERFIADPFSEANGARLYRTGDLARVREDDQIIFVGRRDDQIKIRGYRVEPAEIEIAIDRHPAVASSVVVIRGLNCEQRLTAYITMRNGRTPSASELRDSLRSSLPDYMLPTLFVKLDTLPVTANGKVDRAALPEPNGENTLRDEQFAAPSTPLEHRLTQILCELFNQTQVGVNDNFFLLGGHSLLGAQLIVKIRSAFGVDLPLRTLFDAPTIADLSREVERLIVARINSLSEEQTQALLA